MVALSPAYQYKWCPIIWVWVSIFERELGVAQGCRPSDAFAQVFVPILHQLRCRLVLHEPQAGHERRSPGPEERSCQAHELVASEDRVARRLAGTQGYKGAREIKPYDVAGRQPTI